MISILDFSHRIHNDMPVFPGDRLPVFEDMATMEKDGFREKWLQLTSHTGTHIDAPSHIIPEGKGLSDFPVSQFHGKAYIAAVQNVVGHIRAGDVPEEILIPGTVDFILFYTGMDKHWGSERYFGDFPVLSLELADRMAGIRLKGIGTDCISFDPVDARELKNHRVLMKAEMILIENLTNLEPYCHRYLTFSCFPLNISEGDGSPVRAIGYLDINEGSDR